MAEPSPFKVEEVEELRRQVEMKTMSMTAALQIAASRGARSGIEALGAQFEGMPEWDEEIARDVSVTIELHFPRLGNLQEKPKQVLRQQKGKQKHDDRI